jgi:uncharacterized protein DUF5615
MAHFLIDENLSRLFATKLRSLQVRAEDVREVGLQGREDGEILAYAIAHRRTLLTADLRFSPGTPDGYAEGRGAPFWRRARRQSSPLPVGEEGRRGRRVEAVLRCEGDEALDRGLVEV